MSRALAGYARWKMERAPAAAQMIVEATAWLEQGGRYQYISLNYGWLAEIMVESDRIAEARLYAARALRRARKRDPMGEAMAMRAMARAAAREGWPRPPDHYLERAMASARGAERSRMKWRSPYYAKPSFAFAAGDGRRALASLAEARRTFAALGMDWHGREAISLARRLESQSPRPRRPRRP